MHVRSLAAFPLSWKSCECKRLLNHALKLWKGQGNDFRAAETLAYLSNTNQRIDLYQEGITGGRRPRVFERPGHPVRRVDQLVRLALLPLCKEQLDAAEETAFHATDLLPGGEQNCVYDYHLVLG